MKWWESNPQRFEIEKRLLASSHPGSKMVIKNGKMRVLKTLKTRRDCYLIEAIFNERHPYSDMKVFVREPRLKKSTPHRYGSEELCLHNDDDVGPETTAKVYLDWAIQWIRTYERWLDGKSWPKTNRGY